MIELKNEEKNIKQGAFHKAHVLGCNSTALDKSADTILIITDGTCHAINNAIQLQREIYIFTTNTLDKIEQKEIDTHNKKTLTKQKKFLLANNIGLIVSTKHGQHQKAIHKIKERIENKNNSIADLLTMLIILLRFYSISPPVSNLSVR